MRPAAIWILLVFCRLLLGASQGLVYAQTNVIIDATLHRSIGGVGTLDRAKYFNHWGTHTNGMGSLADELISATGLHSVTGRETFEYDGLVAAGLGEDPANPGFFRRSDLAAVLQGSYKNWVLNGSRWESLRDHPNPAFVQSGRANGSWPAWILDGTTMPIKGDGAAYGDFLNVYLEEVVYGTGPGQGYLPFAKDRFYVEIMNEPQLELNSGVTWNDVIEFHKNVTVAVKEQFPQANIGGASVGEAPLPIWNPHRWDLAKQMMDDMTTWQDSSGNAVEFDFWTFHPYDVHRVRNNGAIETQVRESAGHLEAIMDLFESYSDIKFGDPKQFAVTEYGATIYTENGSQNFAGYTRERRQWDEMRDIKKKLMVFMDRPDRILNATPFIAPQWFTESSPTEESGAHYVMWDKQANGSFKETIIAGMYRMFNDVQGDYVGIDTDNSDIQSIAFRDGNQLHVVLNNLSTTNQPVNLQAMVGSAAVTSAAIDRVTWNGLEGVHVDNQDATGSWQNLTLAGEEGVKLTLTLDSAIGFNSAVNERTFYGDDVQAPITMAGSTSKIINIAADMQDAASARMRVAIAERASVWNETFQVFVNGNSISVPATGPRGFDDADSWLFSREIDVPLALLNDGNNEVYVDFNSNGGQLVTTSLIVTSDPNVAEPPTQSTTFDWEVENGAVSDSGFAMPVTQTIGDLELVFDSGTHLTRNDSNGVENSFIFNQTNLHQGSTVVANMTLIDHSQGGIEVPFRLDSIDFADSINVATTMEGIDGGAAVYSVDVPATTQGGDIFEVTQSTDENGDPLRETEVDSVRFTFVNQVAGAFRFPAVDNIVILTNFAQIDGDFNFDGFVNEQDLAVWEASYGLDAGADADNDGLTAGDDFLIWQGNVAATAAPNAAIVPEPSSVLLLLSAILLVTRGAGRRVCRATRGTSIVLNGEKRDLI